MKMKVNDLKTKYVLKWFTLYQKFIIINNSLSMLYSIIYYNIDCLYRLIETIL